MSLNWPYRSTPELASVIPVFPLEGILLLPGNELPLSIFEPRYIEMVDNALRTHRLIGMIQPATTTKQGTGQPELESIGCVGRITQFAESGDARYALTLTGVCRFRIKREIESEFSFREFEVDFTAFVGDLSSDEKEPEIDRGQLMTALKKFQDARNLAIDWDAIRSAPLAKLVNAISMTLPMGPREKQALLEAYNVERRSELLFAMAEFETAQKSGTGSRLQ